ncbi:MAG: Crp/Fnr family transcriptional regulator [Saprospiraceae bacterium]
MSELSFQAELLAFTQRSGQSFSIARGQLLQAPHARTSPLFLLQSGAAHAFIDSESGRQSIRLGYPGEQLSVLPGLFQGTTSAIGIESIRKCEGLSLTKAQLDEFVHSSPAISAGYTLLLEQFACDLVIRELDLLEPSPQRRYEAVLARSPQLFQHVPLRYIASYLRMSPETLSRIRAKSQS